MRCCSHTLNVSSEWNIDQRLWSLPYFMNPARAALVFKPFRVCPSGAPVRAPPNAPATPKHFVVQA
ncbi:hypothetical protein BAUCODRAFT_332834 [Baudoinia panamericana UAMH 10762]|uniref:Uncharacterized protein n=1 Tax=Baudoinia panamericana (strain UAMH 10762) TaxID=717646 RepID=M2MI85_BAUPA|nr:uncharacterized protein BAUCODRAFT_332834 [Baudoinia panamericana UAMH 10762]EMC90983.1 hypothetical protein BAUCODRAFT_332834 [Baudoinia panamericana UAMH 10762]